jgi:two-component system phosphate regulon sensor histidine kinase PhoR
MMPPPAGGVVNLRERVLLELARRDKSDLDETFQAITEAAAVVLDVARVSIWALVDRDSPANARIVCNDLYIRAERKHVSFMPIHGDDYPAYFSALFERRTIAAHDARTDPRTREFAEHYLDPLGISSMMDTPIWHRGQVYGVLCFEHIGPPRVWQADEQAFAINMADIASSCLETVDHAAERRRWDTVISSLTEGVALVDANGVMVQCNRAARRSLFEGTGLSKLEELVTEVDLVDAADRRVPPADWPFQRVLRREKVQGEIYGLIFKRTGERRYIRLTCSPVVEGGQIKFVAFIAVDATEEMIVERLRSELLSGVAHALKTPLAIAKGYAQQMECAKTTPEKGDRMLEAIIRACDRMDHLSETLLDLASMMLGRLQLTRERVDLAELALSVVRRAERAAPRHHFNLKVRPNICVIVDSTRISEALRHVIDNAIAYSPDGSPIEIELDAEEERAVLSVRDRGIGISEEGKRKLFTLFAKVHAGTEHDRGGLGVGLYLAREIVRRHAGEMWFESAEGEGSTFHLALPLARST